MTLRRCSGLLAVALATLSSVRAEAHSPGAAPSAAMPATARPATPRPPAATAATAIGTLINVRPPLSAEVKIFDGANLVARFTGAGSVTVASGRTYSVVAERDGAMLWSGTVPAPKGGSVDILWEDPASQAPAAPIAATPPAPPTPATPPTPPPTPSAMDGRAFADLRDTVADTFFDRDKLAILRAARRPVTAAQAHVLLSIFDFERERWQAFEILRPRLVDPENGHLLARNFFFPRDKRRVLGSFARP